MRYSKKIQVVSLLALLLSIKTEAQKNIRGRYHTSGIHSGSTLTLGPDMTFTYKHVGGISADTAAGGFALNGDTVILKYTYNNYDSTLISRDPSITSETRLNASLASAHRPKTLLAKANRLYFIDKKTGRLQTYLLNSKTEYVYMTRF